jgi:hypothetical protein
MTTSAVPRHTIGRFLRDKQGNPIGLVCATKDNAGAVSIGWSFTAKADRTQGRVSKSRAWAIALGRVEGGTSARCPHALIPLVNEIVERATRYFKVPQTAVWKIPLG